MKSADVVSRKEVIIQKSAYGEKYQIKIDDTSLSHSLTPTKQSEDDDSERPKIIQCHEFEQDINQKQEERLETDNLSQVAAHKLQLSTHREETKKVEFPRKPSVKKAMK